MEPPKRPPLQRSSVVKDMAIIVPFFIVMIFGLKHTIPTNDPLYLWIHAVIGSSCVSAVAWLALQMFKVVLFDEEKDRT